MLAALGIHGFLAQERLATSKLTVELVVQIVAVGNDHYGRAVQPLLQKMRKEHHGERLARALRVPEHADLSIAAHGLNSTLRRLAHCKILVVSGKNLDHALC